MESEHLSQQIKTKEDEFYTAEEALIIIDENGLINQVNQAWINLCTKYKLERISCGIGAGYFALLQQHGLTNELAEAKGVLNRELDTYEKMHVFSMPNGEFQEITVSMRPIDLPVHGFKGAVLSFKPIDLYSAEQITAESVLESMNDAFFILDPHFNVTYINDLGELILRRTRKEVIGENLWKLFPEAKEGTLFYEEYNRALKDNIETQFESFYAPLGTWLSVKVYPLKRGGLAIYFQDIGDQKLAEKKLTEYAYYDYLTELPNRRMLANITAALREQKKKFSIFFINLDNLNFINNLYGYNTGDLVLKSVAKKLKELTGEGCEAGRPDGDKFIFIRQHLPSEKVEQFAQRILAAFDEAFILDDFQSVKVSASIGIACYPFDTDNAGNLLAYAEIAMAEARKTKSSSYTFFRPKMNSERSRRLKIEEGLLGDFKDSGFYFTLQPQIDGNSGKIIGAEVLSRWNHPDFGELSPLEFIEAAEQSGTIAPLTRHLLTEVFAKMKEWEARYGMNLKIAINMTPSLLSNTAFFSDFLHLMDEYGIRPEWIEIEITEQAELTYSEQTLENLLLCQSKGISIAIDDFGTGFSMIAYLTQFPINKIKIDKFFVQKIGQDKKSEAVLKSLIHLAKSIECDLLAEGVERLEEVEFLTSSGCTVFQGYLFDKPLKTDDFETKYLKFPERGQADVHI